MMASLKTAVIALTMAFMVWEGSCADRRFYVRAENVLWDYAPDGTNVVYGRDYNAFENRFVVSASSGGKNTTFGSKLWKVQLVEYTDETFTTKVVRSPEWQHLGGLGPVIRGEVGDVLYITFRNSAEVSLTLHPHGVKYEKDSEGAPYEDKTSGKDKVYCKHLVILFYIIQLFTLVFSTARRQCQPRCYAHLPMGRS
tara:strand:+ start:372 stop:962 length:591 start_codon:yes stop_codon:yes gene_type:complete